jgi:pimeloyl-ACP methyl ester carboxylesterase
MPTLVFVHGWSATSTATYGTLPQRVQQRAEAAGLTLSVADLWLSEYVSFDDIVTMDDLVRGFDHALRQLDLPDAPFACVTHSFGGPLVRSWLQAQRTYPGAFSARQLSHLVMLAPPNFGSPLAHLGQGVAGRLKAWWSGVEPGERILDWLEQGSAESLRLNLEHIHGADPASRGQFLFVLTGDRPDRALYDHLNCYTGENGSDGVVRIAAANLNARHAVLKPLERTADKGIDVLAPQVVRAPHCAFKLIPGASHAGIAQGIMASSGLATDAMIVRCLWRSTTSRATRSCAMPSRRRTPNVTGIRSSSNRSVHSRRGSTSTTPAAC